MDEKKKQKRKADAIEANDDDNEIANPPVIVVVEDRFDRLFRDYEKDKKRVFGDVEEEFEKIALRALEVTEWAQIVKIEAMSASSEYSGECRHLNLKTFVNGDDTNADPILDAKLLTVECVRCHLEVHVRPFVCPDKCPACNKHIEYVHYKKGTRHIEWNCSCYLENKLEQAIQQKVVTRETTELLVRTKFGPNVAIVSGI